MKQEFFTFLPPEIVIDILSRLPVRTIITCKCVCKSWLGLLETHEFAMAHLSKSAPGLAVYQSRMDSNLYKIFEFEDGLDLEHHDLHYVPVTKFSLPYHGLIHGSANGLLFLRDPSRRRCGFYICNPITREFINLHCPQEFEDFGPQVFTYAYGFGASKITGQLKVVRILQDCTIDRETRRMLEVTKSECHVYTLGTGSWRSIALGVPFEYHFNFSNGAAVVNGNLHWLVCDFKGSSRISYFDLETDTFSTFSPPPLHRLGILAHLFALEDRLYLCDITSNDCEIIIWLMKEYGVEKSWSKELVISQNPDFARESYEVGYSSSPSESCPVYPIKVFKDGDILMAWEDSFLFYYSGKTKTAQKVDMFTLHAPDNNIEAVLHTLSFLSLKSFRMENVISF